MKVAEILANIPLEQLLYCEEKAQWRIYCDSDGVLNDFDSECTKHLGPTWKDWPAGKFWGVLSKRPSHFFLHSQPLPDANDLISYLKHQEVHHGHEFSILGALPRPTGKLATAEEDKRDWLLQHFQLTKADFIIGGRRKAGFAKSKRDILIDDTPRNVEAWENAGGTGVLHTSAKDTIEQLKKLLNS